MYEGLKKVLSSFGLVFVLLATSFWAGVYTGSRTGKLFGNENYSDQIKQVFDIARNSIISERARLDSERENIAGLRDGLERERKRLEYERRINKTDREDLLRLEYLIDEAIKRKSDN